MSDTQNPNQIEGSGIELTSKEISIAMQIIKLFKKKKCTAERSIEILHQTLKTLEQSVTEAEKLHSHY